MKFVLVVKVGGKSWGPRNHAWVWTRSSGLFKQIEGQELEDFAAGRPSP